MAHSVVKVTDAALNDSLFLLVGEDGTVTPDRETVDSFLGSRDGPTDLQIMHISKSDGKSLEVSVDNLTYINSDEIDDGEDMDEVARNLLGFRLDHDYTPLTSPSQITTRRSSEVVDELAETLRILDGSDAPKPSKGVKIIKSTKARKTPFKSPKNAVVRQKLKARVQVQEEVEDEEEEDDEDYVEDEVGVDDENDSDFEYEDVKPKAAPRGKRTRKKSQSEKKGAPQRKSVGPKGVKTPETEKVPELLVHASLKQPDKKPPKKEKKPPKPIPDDFALFSTPDIIRRVGGKEPTTPTTPDMPGRPAKIEGRTKSNSERTALSAKASEIRRRASFDRAKLESRKSSVNSEMVQIQNVVVNDNTNSSEAMENAMEPMPTVEDIRSVILNEDTKSYTTSLVLPETEQSVEKGNFNLEGGGLDLDQSILDNINSDLISEDILYQVAKQLVDNTDLQNVIDKSIVDGNLILDPSIQNSIMQNDGGVLQPSTPNTNQQTEHQSDSNKGTQIVRPDGRIVVIPPIERPATRSRNRKKPDAPPTPSQKVIHKPLDEEHVSGNELDSSEEEEENSEDDPNKLWCVCNQPHNNRFMICCDTCEEWYHGKCVNVTKAMGQLMEQEGREWICVYCKDPTLARPSAAARRIRKASRASTDSSGSAKKSVSAASLTTDAVKTAKVGAPALACIVCGKSSRKNSIYCSEACILKHAQGVERVVVFDRTSGKILSGNKAPSAANIEEWLQKHPAYEVVRSTSKNMLPQKQHFTQSRLKLVKNEDNDGVSLAVQKKGVSVGVLSHTPKQLQAKTPVKAHITGLKLVKKPIPNQKPRTILPKSPVTPSPSSSSSSTPSKVKVQTTLKSPPAPKDRPIPQKTPKARQAEQTPQPKQENIRENICKTLSEQLMNRLKKVDDLVLTEEEVNNISTEIESQLYKCFGDTGQKYKNKYRSLIFNIKDAKNQTLWRRICEKSVNPYQLVRLSPDDLASQELALWREREAKHQLDMIKKSELELLNCNRQYVFKTHKGEQVLEDGHPTDAIDSTEVIATLGADSTSLDEKSDSKDSKKHARRDKDGKLSRDGRRSRERDSDRRKRSRSKDRGGTKKRSRERSRDRRRRSSHKSSRHKKDATTDKLDKKSKEILEQLVDKQIVPPLEDRLWKHVQQEDITAAPTAESDSDHEPSSTVTIPTPPRSIDLEELHPNSSVSDDLESKDGKSADDSVRDVQEGSSSPTRPPPEFVWKGTINMVDVAQISITAHEVSGDCNGLGDELPKNLDIVGRISPDTVWDYITKMKCSNSKVISLIRLNATNVEEKMPYIALYSYLSSRNRLGVVKSVNKAVKDFYILPLAVQKPIPQALLPLNGPGFEESRPPLLLGIIVRDKRKRPLHSDTPVHSKRIKVELDIPEPPSTPPPQVAPPPPVTRSYTPPPSRDPRLKLPPYAPLPAIVTPAVDESSSSVTAEVEEEEVVAEADDDENEPYSPEDSDPDTAPVPEAGSSRLNADDLSNLLTGTVKASSFLESGLKTQQTFEPFANKFDAIPGLDDAATLPSSSQELQRKMAELDQRIAIQKAEIDNMSQDIVSSATASADLGTNALANIALPSNLQQILDSIKTIGTVASTDSQDTITTETTPTTATPTSANDLTIPLLLPKISSRTQKSGMDTKKSTMDTKKSTVDTKKSTTDTIPLNIPMAKAKRSVQEEKMQGTTTSSVLSSLSEEDLIRKAAEMLGEESEPVAKKAKEGPDFSTPPPFKPSLPFMFSTPPPPQQQQVKKQTLDLPPVPGLEDES